MADNLSKYGIWPTIAVKDVDRAKEFYEEVLGYKQKMGDDMGVVYQGKDGTGLLVYPSEFAGTNKATYACWNVDDLDELVADLREKGVEFDELDQPGIKTTNGVATMEMNGKTMKAAWFRDPDGNILNITQM